MWFPSRGEDKILNEKGLMKFGGNFQKLKQNFQSKTQFKKIQEGQNTCTKEEKLISRGAPCPLLPPPLFPSNDLTILVPQNPIICGSLLVI